MILSKEKITEMLEAAKPLIKWMADNVHIHCTATVDYESVELSESIAREVTDEFLEKAEK